MMKLFSFIACGVYANIVFGAIFKAPVYSVSRKGENFRSKLFERSAERSFKSGSDSEHIQQPLVPDGDEKAWMSDDVQEAWDKTTGASLLWDVEQLVYITNISVGTPPQHFSVLLSISTSDILLPSTLCGFTCNYRYPQYDSNHSSTYVANGTVITRNYPRFSASAIVSQDTFCIAGIEIKNVSFAEATNIYMHGEGTAIGLGDDQWDGILGIAPHGGNADATPNFDAPLDDPFLSMISQRLLDRNIFGLKFSNGTDHPEEIMFGGINHDLYEGELKTLPLLNDTDDTRQIPGRWNVPATKITIGPGWVSLKGYVATLDSDTPFIGLPGLFVVLLHNYLGMEKKGEQGPYPIPYSIDCSRRDELDNLTLTLGDHDFVITPYQYTIEMDVEEWGGRRCISAFWPSNPNQKFIGLGSSFLGAFYGVFDLDERTVSFGKLKEGKA